MSTLKLSFHWLFRDAHYKIPPMDPAKLEYFRTVKEITGGSEVLAASLYTEYSAACVDV